MSKQIWTDCGLVELQRNFVKHLILWESVQQRCFKKTTELYMQIGCQYVTTYKLLRIAYHQLTLLCNLSADWAISVWVGWGRHYSKTLFHCQQGKAPPPHHPLHSLQSLRYVTTCLSVLTMGRNPVGELSQQNRCVNAVTYSTQQFCQSCGCKN